MKLLTNDFRFEAASHFYDEVAAANSRFYVFLGRSYSFDNNGDAPGSQPILEDNVWTTYYSSYDDMVGGKRVTASDITFMVKKYEWTSNTVYRQYDDKMTDPYNLGGSLAPFYVVTTHPNATERCVYKCLFNNNGAASTVQPTSTDASLDIYETPGDGYRWKFMYKYDIDVKEKFETVDLVPCIADANVAGNAIHGSIDSIIVDSPGAVLYTAITNGAFEAVYVGGNNQIFRLQANTSSAQDRIYDNSAIYLPVEGEQRRIVYYSSYDRTIVLDAPFDETININTEYEIVPNIVIGGDGIGARARAIVNTANFRVEKVLVTARGADYTYVLGAVQGYTGVEANSTNQPILRTILPPYGGHGADACKELGARRINIAVTMNQLDSNSKMTAKNDFRTVGLLKNPLFSNVALVIAETPTQALADNAYIIQPETGAFGTVVERIDGDSIIVLTNAGGIFTANTVYVPATNTYITVTAISAAPTTYFDQTHRFVANNKPGATFTEDQILYQPEREDSANALTQSFFNATGIFHSANNTTAGQRALIRMVNKKGTFNNSDVVDEWTVNGKTDIAGEPSAKIESQVRADIVYGTGDVLYIENMPPISCGNNQTETFRLVLEF